MARMSIDDLFLRDPRVRALADDLGGSKYEARGRLLDVFAVAYDRVDCGGSPVLTHREIDLAAEFDGLADAMVKHNLAANVRAGLRIKGADERTKYLATRESSGRAGGLKSAETRRNKAKLRTKVTFEKTEGPLNPPDPNLLDPNLLERERGGTPPARASDPEPNRSPPEPNQQSAAYDPEDPRARGRLALAIWSEISAARVAIAAELGMGEVLPLAVVAGGVEPGGFRELRSRIREEGRDAPRVCTHIREVLIAQARSERSVEWLSDKAFTEGGWRTARAAVPGWRRQSRGGANGEPGPAIRLRSKPDDMPPLMPAPGGKS